MMASKDGNFSKPPLADSGEAIRALYPWAASESLFYSRKGRACRTLTSQDFQLAVDHWSLGNSPSIWHGVLFGGMAFASFRVLHRFVASQLWIKRGRTVPFTFRAAGIPVYLPCSIMVGGGAWITSRLREHANFCRSLKEPTAFAQAMHDQAQSLQPQLQKQFNREQPWFCLRGQSVLLTTLRDTPEGFKTSRPDIGILLHPGNLDRERNHSQSPAAGYEPHHSPNPSESSVSSNPHSESFPERPATIEEPESRLSGKWEQIRHKNPSTQASAWESVRQSQGRKELARDGRVAPPSQSPIQPSSTDEWEAMLEAERRRSNGDNDSKLE
ncbi:hypothetical protein DL96DRAFT_1594262 [Flagelloscypha sp. PMI_526]|nr:hypothetical protein DL96DRAFT_1594262 [Flagelloscypha sp. PMI_526]